MPTPLLPDIADNSTFGSPYQDFDTVVDPTTELGSVVLNRLIAQVAMLSHTAPRAWCRVFCAGSPNIFDHDAVWGNTAGVIPTVNKTGTGQYTVAWGATPSDLQPVPETHALNIRAIQVCSATNGNPLTVRYGFTATTVSLVFYFNATLTDPTEFILTVW